MPRRPNPQCRACAALSASEAHAKPCWAGEACHKRRTYYRRLQEREQFAGVPLPNPDAPVTIQVPLPPVLYAILYRYLTSNGGLHAVVTELYRGEKPIARTPPQHVGALTNEVLRQYLSNILSAYSQHADRTISLFRDQVDLPLSRYGCPIRDCPSSRG